MSSITIAAQAKGVIKKQQIGFLYFYKLVAKICKWHNKVSKIMVKRFIHATLPFV